MTGGLPHPPDHPDATRTPAGPDAIRPVAVPRHAATLIVLDASLDVPQVLMGRRSATARFMPGMDVFPGGAVDAADYGAPAASPLVPLTLAHLCRAADPPLAAALGIAAARELQEETGLSLDTPPRLAGLRYLCRAVTPADRPIRFDARFLVVDRDQLAPHGPDLPTLIDAELDGLAWHRLDALHVLHLPRPTRAALELLAARLAGVASWPATLDAALPLLRGDQGWGTE